MAAILLVGLQLKISLYWDFSKGCLVCPAFIIHWDQFNFTLHFNVYVRTSLNGPHSVYFQCIISTPCKYLSKLSALYKASNLCCQLHLCHHLMRCVCTEHMECWILSLFLYNILLWTLVYMDTIYCFLCENATNYKSSSYIFYNTKCTCACPIMQVPYPYTALNTSIFLCYLVCTVYLHSPSIVCYAYLAT